MRVHRAWNPSSKFVTQSFFSLALPLLRWASSAPNSLLFLVCLSFGTTPLKIGSATDVRARARVRDAAHAAAAAAAAAGSGGGSAAAGHSVMSSFSVVSRKMLLGGLA